MVPKSSRGARAAKLFAALIALLGLLGATPGWAATLTGMVLFTANSHGRIALGPAWNTVGGDIVPNLYLSATGPGGAIINPGNGSSVGLSVPLDPGTHTFNLFGGAFTEAPDFFGVNLFFDNATVPGISLYGVPGSGLFTANSSLLTPRLTSIPPFTGLFAPGAGTLTYGNVTLTGFAWNEPDSTDRVRGFNSTPNGIKDFTGTMTLTVTPVPVPAALPLLASALGVLGWMGRRSARRRSAAQG